MTLNEPERSRQEAVFPGCLLGEAFLGQLICLSGFFLLQRAAIVPRIRLANRHQDSTRTAAMVKLKFDLNKTLKYDDPRDVPSYSIPEAAQYLGIPQATLRTWVLGRDYSVESGQKRFLPIIGIADRRANLLSFFNLVELHVLSAFRKKHNILLRRIRSALGYVTKEHGWERPLIQQEFKTDGVGLLIERLGKLVDASSGGQRIMRNVVDAHLQRIEWEEKIASRLYPFTRPRDLKSPKSVFIDPRYSFGKPILARSHIPTGIIAERYRAGDSIEDLTKDYGCTQPEIEEGLRCELNIAAAA